MLAKKKAGRNCSRPAERIANRESRTAIRVSTFHPFRRRLASPGVFLLLGDLGDERFGRQHQRRDRRGVLQRRPHDLRRVDDARAHEVLVLLGRRVVAVVALRVLHLAGRRWSLPGRRWSRSSAAALRSRGSDADADGWSPSSFSVSSALPRGSARRRRPGRCPLRPPPASRAWRLRRAPSSPSSRSRWPHRP